MMVSPYPRPRRKQGDRGKKWFLRARAPRDRNRAGGRARPRAVSEKHRKRTLAPEHHKKTPHSRTGAEKRSRDRDDSPSPRVPCDAMSAPPALGTGADATTLTTTYHDRDGGGVRFVRQRRCGRGEAPEFAVRHVPVISDLSGSGRSRR